MQAQQGLEASLPERPRLNLGLALDRSGSMAGDKIRKAREAAIFVVKQLTPQDRVAIVAYDSEVELVLPSTPATDKTAIIAAIERIHDRGSTHLFGGWSEAAHQVAQHLDPAALNRVLLLTDGLANQGLTDPQEIGRHVGELARRGVSTSTLGIGRDFNEDLLALMADRGEGNFYFIESSADLPRIFALELSGLLATFAKQVRLELEGAGWQVEMHNEFNRDPHGAYRLPDLTHGLPLELAVTLSVPPGPLQGKLKLSWEDSAGKRRQMSLPLRLEAVDAATFAQLPERKEVMAYLAKLEATQARREAMAYLDRGELKRAGEVLMAAAPMMLKFEDIYPEETQELQELRKLIEEDYSTARKRMSAQSLRNLKGKR
jgi:Ca-activated chloride channel family protein